MPVYEFSCEGCGRFEAQHPMASVPDAEPCPSCSADSRRVISAVGLSHGNSPRMRAVEDSARSASAPDVVAGSPGRPRATPTTSDPRHQKLPRP